MQCLQCYWKLLLIQNYLYKADIEYAYRSATRKGSATAIGNTHEKLAKVRHVVLEISSRIDTQKDRLRALPATVRSVRYHR